jgi:5-methylcytosine-specific restriction endonuclease McrA
MATQSQINKTWNNAKTIRGKNSDMYRQDPYGKKMYKYSYGKSSEMGWEVDHIKPSNKGGSDATRNLQALNTSVNRSKGDSLVKKSRHNQ